MPWGLSQGQSAYFLGLLGFLTEPKARLEMGCVLGGCRLALCNQGLTYKTRLK